MTRRSDDRECSSEKFFITCRDSSSDLAYEVPVAEGRSLVCTDMRTDSVQFIKIVKTIVSRFDVVFTFGPELLMFVVI